GSAWTDYLQHDRAVVEHAFEEILDHYRNGRIKIGKVQSVNLDGVPSALEAIDKRQHHGRILLVN
ncbi:MAG: hypothetical protein ACU84Q_06315, partial [Gammaproteobacteria bacterium]